MTDRAAIGRLAVALGLAASSSMVACSGGGGASPDGGGGAGAGGDAGASKTGHCTRPVLATWKQNGVAFDAEIALVSHVGDSWQINVIACAASNEDIEFASLPPLGAVQTIPLDFFVFAGLSGNGHGGAQYVDHAGVGYYTDATHTGELDVTSFDGTNNVISGTFSFMATTKDPNAATTGSVDITDGTLTNLKIPVP